MRQPPEHGTRACYLKGCRQDECRKANAAYKNSSQTRRREATARTEKVRRQLGLEGPNPEIPHGTQTGYYSQGCRCQECREAVRPLVNKWRRQRRIINISQTINQQQGA